MASGGASGLEKTAMTKGIEAAALLAASRSYLSVVQDLEWAQRDVDAALEHRTSVLRALDRSEVALSDAADNWSDSERRRVAS